MDFRPSLARAGNPKIAATQISETIVKPTSKTVANDQSRQISLSGSMDDFESGMSSQQSGVLPSATKKTPFNQSLEVANPQQLRDQAADATEDTNEMGMTEDGCDSDCTNYVTRKGNARHGS